MNKVKLLYFLTILSKAVERKPSENEELYEDDFEVYEDDFESYEEEQSDMD